MAIKASGGYANLPSGNWLPAVYSQKVLKYFRRTSVAEDITNTDYAGEIENYGDTVKIIKEPTVSVSSYNRGAVVNTQDLADNQTTLVVDTANYFAFKVDDIEERQSHVNWEALATSSGAYALKRKYDRDILEGISTATSINSGTTVTVTTGATAFDILAEAARVLDDNHVPEEGRWFVAAPKYYQYLGHDDSKVVDMSVMAASETSPLRNGMVTNKPVMGFNLYKSTALNRSGTDIITVSGTSNGFFCMAGHMSSTATASHIAKTEVVRDTDSFSDIVRGLHVYGLKVLRPEAIVRSVAVIA